MSHDSLSFIFFFFNDTATTEIYTLSLHDALPIFSALAGRRLRYWILAPRRRAELHERIARRFDSMMAAGLLEEVRDRKSTRLNSSHLVISYAVFCLKKKKRTHVVTTQCT